jgi:acyl dehydratase
MGETSVTVAWDQTLFGKPEVGKKASRSRQVSSADIQAFTDITGDRNPLHYDEDFARKTVFGRIIVQGGVTSGILNAIVAEDLPGPGTVFLGVEWKFVRAVGPGDTIIGEIEIMEVRNDKPICVISTVVRNGEGQICLEGKATTYTVTSTP